VYRPILATVLGASRASATVARGVLLLRGVSAGLQCIPAAALGIGQFLRSISDSGVSHAVEVLSGALLVFVGSLVFLNRLDLAPGKLDS